MTCVYYFYVRLEDEVRQGGNEMKSTSIWYFLFFILFSNYTYVNAQTYNDTLSETLNTIADFSERMRNKITQEGYRTTANTKLELKGGLTALSKKIAEVGAKASTDISSDKYVNVLQEQLKDTLAQSDECRRKLFSELKSTIPTRAIEKR